VFTTRRYTNPRLPLPLPLPTLISVSDDNHLLCETSESDHQLQLCTDLQYRFDALCAARM